MKVVMFIHGKGGTGKTYYAKKLLDKLGYDYCVSSSSNDPFQDYMGQQAIILDDLREAILIQNITSRERMTAESTPGVFMKRLVFSVKDRKLPLLAKPPSENLMTEKPIPENPTQLNTKEVKTKESNTN